VALALFDLDNTLLNGDSDHGWGMFLAEIGAVDAKEQQTRQDYFYQQYVDGTLDIIEFCEYQFSILSNTSVEQLHSWHEEFMVKIIEPMIVSGKPELIEPHRAAGDDILIITATNNFVTQPIAERLGVSNLLATEAEFIEGRYTGKVSGTPCFQGGKVSRLEEWMRQNNKNLQGSVFYSDSVNDLPLLKAVDTPVAVTPDDKLRAHAENQGWRIID